MDEIEEDDKFRYKGEEESKYSTPWESIYDLKFCSFRADVNGVFEFTLGEIITCDTFEDIDQVLKAFECAKEDDLPEEFKKNRISKKFRSAKIFVLLQIENFQGS